MTVSGRNRRRDRFWGHEPAGTVAAVGEDVERLREGDSVAAPFNLSDGTCPACRTGHSNVCEKLLTIGSPVVDEF